jgi:hypothetical protein
MIAKDLIPEWVAVKTLRDHDSGASRLGFAGHRGRHPVRGRTLGSHPACGRAFGAIFGLDMLDPARRDQYRAPWSASCRLPVRT